MSTYRAMTTPAVIVQPASAMLIHTLIALLKSSIAGLDPAAKDNAMQAIADLNADAGGTANPKRQRTSHYGTFEFCNDNYFIHSRSTYAYRSPPLTIRFSPVRWPTDLAQVAESLFGKSFSAVHKAQFISALGVQAPICAAAYLSEESKVCNSTHFIVSVPPPLIGCPFTDICSPPLCNRYPHVLLNSCHPCF